MNYFLAKTDPETYSIDDLQKDQETWWDGVHNYQAINVIKSWQIGDMILMYHSVSNAAIVGLAQVTGLPIKDDQDKRGISWKAKVKFIKKFPETDRISLKMIKESGLFENFLLVTHSRLSTMNCPDNFIEWVKSTHKGLLLPNP